MIVRELFNGVSMILPLAMIALRAPATKYGVTAVIGTALHVPVSCGYHLMCATHLNPDPLNCVGRKLDQTFIHINAAMLAYSTSHSIQYTAAAAAINTRYIHLLWSGDDTPQGRRVRIFLAYVIYLLPVFYVNVRIGSRMFFTLVASSMAFLFDKSLRGVGHTVFHLGLGAAWYDLSQVI